MKRAGQIKYECPAPFVNQDLNNYDQKGKVKEVPLFSLERLANKVFKLALWVAGINLALMVLLTTTDVVLRYFFNSPIQGSAELTEFMMVAAGFLGLGLCALERQHINVEILAERFPQKIQMVIDKINSLVVLGLSLIFGWQSIMESLVVQQLELRGPVTGIPHYPFYWIVTLGYFLLALAALILLAKSVSPEVKQ